MTLGELAVRFGCELRGDPAATVDSVAALSSAGPGSISFLANPKYVAQLAETRAGAVILDAKSAASSPVPVLIVANPHATYARVATLLHPDPKLVAGVHPAAHVEAGATIDPSSQICAHAFVGEGSRIGARCFVGPGVVIERGAVLGDDSRLAARVFVGHHVVFGRRCIVQPGAIIGGDGFGYAPIDRGALGDTVIEEGVKIDNLIMIAHNCRIGAHSALAACVAIAGSSVVGKRCILGGKVGLTGHITLCDDVVVLGTSFISHSISKPGVYSSALPSEEAGLWRRIVGRIKRLDVMAKRLRAVEKHLGLGAAHKDSFED
jgi:UDP-3-O-[3-hydroxymyristoyl] glucosamine N-acyltransferase